MWKLCITRNLDNKLTTEIKDIIEKTSISSIDECHTADDHDEEISDTTVMISITNNPSRECLSMIAEFLNLFPPDAGLFDEPSVVGSLDVLPAVVNEQCGSSLARNGPIIFLGGSHNFCRLIIADKCNTHT